MLDEKPVGFEGGMIPKKYKALIKTFKAIQTIDFQDLAAKTIYTYREGT